MLNVNIKFPGFHLNGVNSENQIVQVKSADLTGSWAVIYFYPKDFTFICPTEISEMDKLCDEAIVMGVSGDNEYCKLNWKMSNELIGSIKHTLAADCGLVLASSCEVVNMEHFVSERATFIIDPEGFIQHVSMNAMDTGRDVNELLRTIQALKAGGLTGCGWEPGDQFVA
ncbi:MAG: redoxin domain-containing protein [Pirellulales bacterium]|nr:redoxin domain-containing protein [Pirellulales bacterium]